MLDTSTALYTPDIFSLQSVGGVSRYFVELARHLHASGQRPRVAAGWHVNQLLRVLPSTVVTGLYLTKGAYRFPRLRARLNRLLCQALVGIHPRAVVHQTYYGDTRHLGSRPLVLTVYDLIHELFRAQNPRLRNPDDPTNRYQRANCARADHLIAISESTKADLVRLFGVDPAKVTVVHLANSLPAVDDDAPAAPAPGEDGEYLLHVGPRMGYKNFGAFLEAFGRSALLKARFRIVCFGGEPFSEAELRRFAELKLDGRISQRHGDDRALVRSYRAATAFVYPSLYEGFGLPPLEAMSQRCPVLCGDQSSVPEVAGDAAAYFDPRSVESIQAMLEATLSDPAQLAGLVARGLQRVQEFSWERCARETLAVYRRLAP